MADDILIFMVSYKNILGLRDYGYYFLQLYVLLLALGLDVDVHTVDKHFKFDRVLIEHFVVGRTELGK